MIAAQAARAAPVADLAGELGSISSDRRAALGAIRRTGVLFGAEQLLLQPLEGKPIVAPVRAVFTAACETTEPE